MGVIDDEDSVPLHDTARVGEDFEVAAEAVQESWMSWIYHFFQDWFYTNVIGFLVVSYWRVSAGSECFCDQ